MAVGNFYNESYEKALLGCMLLDNSIIDSVMAKISKEQLSSVKHQQIFEAITSDYIENNAATILTVANRLPAIKADFIASLTDIGTSAEWEIYVTSLKNMWIARKAKAELTEKVNKISPENVVDIVHDLDSSLTSYMSVEKHKSPGVKEACIDLINEIQEASKNKDLYLGYDTGWENLSTILDGVQLGKLIILGARPSIGKTSFALQLATNLCKAGVSTDIVSCEMSKKSLMYRMLSMKSGISIYYLQHGMCTSYAQIQRINMATTEIYNYPLNIFDEDIKDEKELYSLIRVQAKTKGTKVFFIDHIGLLKHSDPMKKRFEQLDDITQGLHKLAQELNVTIICLCQLRRDAEGKKPALNDLRDSGTIEQNADICMFLHRERAMNNETEVETELMVVKNRDGQCGTAEMIFYPKMTRFDEKKQKAV